MLKRIIKYSLLSVGGLILTALLYLFTPGLWNRWVTYPELEKQVNAFNTLRSVPPSLTKLDTYQGLLHVHSYWSHDSEGTLASIIPAAKNTETDFIFLTDHPHGNMDSFPRGYKGSYNGVLIEPGSEKQGFCTWPLDSVVIDWNLEKDSVVKRIVSNGGMIFYAHSEEEHNWGNPHYQGMEIYNIHTDTKDESLLSHVFNLVVNGDPYRHWSYREMFDEQKSILALWDSLNSGRKVVGFAAVDAHENQNLRARYLEDGRIEWLGPNAKRIDTAQLNFWNQWLFQEPDEEGWIFKFAIDTYETSFRYVTNYVMADTLSIPSLARHITKGNLFIAFKSLGDASGFMFCSKDRENTVSAILGDSVRLARAASLHAVSPLPAEFRLIRNGKTLDVSTREEYAYTWPGPMEKGIYRIEAHITLNGELVPWVYTNPIYVY